MNPKKIETAIETQSELLAWALFVENMLVVGFQNQTAQNRLNPNIKDDLRFNNLERAMAGHAKSGKREMNQEY